MLFGLPQKLLHFYERKVEQRTLNLQSLYWFGISAYTNTPRRFDKLQYLSIPFLRVFEKGSREETFFKKLLPFFRER